MKFEEARTLFQNIEKEKVAAEESAKRKDESHEADLYSEMNEIVFSKLDLDFDNSVISEGNKSCLCDFFKGVGLSCLVKNAEDYGILTVSLPLSTFKKPVVLTNCSKEDNNMIFISGLIRTYDALYNNDLAARLINDEIGPKFHFRHNLGGLIFSNKTIEELCKSHKNYLVDIEIVVNTAKTKKAKETILDFRFSYITNKDFVFVKNEEPTDPSIKLAKLAENKRKAAEKKPEHYGDGIPKDGRFVKIVELKDLSELPRIIDKIFE